MARVPFEQAIKAAPYSAETIVESSQTLADGNRISRKTTGQVYRDSEGRTRREEDVTPDDEIGQRLGVRVRSTISIVDPVAGFSVLASTPSTRSPGRPRPRGAVHSWASWKRPMVEGQRKIELEKRMAAAADEKKKAAADERKKGALDEQSVRVLASPARWRGRRRPAAAVHSRGGVTRSRPIRRSSTRRLKASRSKAARRPPSSRRDRSVTSSRSPITSEEWRSPELNLLVLTKHSDPRSGESSYRLHEHRPCGTGQLPLHRARRLHREGNRHPPHGAEDTRSYLINARRKIIAHAR